MRTKKIILFFIAICCSILALNAQTKLGSSTVKVNETATITLNSTYKNVLQYHAAGISYRWYSSNTSTATVSYSGYQSCTVTGKAEGTCRVYFTASFNIDGHYDTYNFYWDVTVSGYTGGGTTIVNPTRAEIIPKELTLHVGETYQMSGVVYPVNATYTSDWAIYQKNIATITSSGVVTAVSPGTTYIYFWVFDSNWNNNENLVPTCELTVLPATCLLDENSAVAPQTANNVNVTVNRTLIADEWNTICLPFAMTSNQLTEAFGDDVLLGEFDGCQIEEDLTEGVKVIKIDFSAAEELEANHPYIVKVADDLTSFTVNGVDVAPTESPVVNRDALVINDGDSPVTLYNQFVGTYVANTIVPTGAFFLSGNKLWKSKGKTPIKAFRGYFMFNNTEGDDEANDVKYLLTFNDDGVASMVEHIETAPSGIILPTDIKAYTLDGRQVNYRNGQLPSKGIYIINGKKKIVK